MKTTVSRVLNLGLWLTGSLLAATGLILAFRLPPGSRGGQGLSLLGWTRHSWGDLHTWAAWVGLALVAAHLALHARWIWIVGSRRRRALLIGVAALGFALPAAALLWPTEGRGGRQGHDEHASLEGAQPSSSPSLH